MNGIEHEGVFSISKKLDEANRTLQKIAQRAQQPAARPAPVVTPVLLPSAHHGVSILTPLPVPLFDIDEFERGIIVDWHDARKTPEEFQRKYGAFPVTPVPMAGEFSQGPKPAVPKPICGQSRARKTIYASSCPYRRSTCPL
jgi:hypothetical protein